MKTLKLHLTLKSAATFGRGDGVPGLVDREIEHDDHGFPFLRGKTLKGVLAESAANINFATGGAFREEQNTLFGRPGRGNAERGIMHVGDARLPQPLRLLLQREQQEKPQEFAPDKILESLTGIRRQTAITPAGAPDRATLRSMRVLVRDTQLTSDLTFARDLTERERAFLAACVLDMRWAGTGRNRGRGWIKAELEDDQTTRDLFNLFKESLP